MCGRFAQINNLIQIKKEFKIKDATLDLIPNFNVTPGTNIIAVIKENDENSLTRFRWGLIPSWAKDESIGYKMINARVETLTEKRSFKNAYENRRCIIIASGFFEWRKVGNTKVPYYISLSENKPFGFAGIWETWKSPEYDEIKSCAIITTQPNDLMKNIHDRMPAILSPENYEKWISSQKKLDTDFIRILKPYPSEFMQAQEVSNFVNNPKNNSQKCLESINNKAEFKF